ncbi:MAG: pyridoxal phosphate-dependent aminotransferase family protein [Spirochaetales bacterium]|nr:pyridoxal phosphate-dependent aminotransferase family protein [Spirochaetales bacterium]
MSNKENKQDISPVFKKCYAFNDANEAKQAGLYPFFKPIQRNSGTKVYIDGRELMMAGSNNYLGLANDIRLKEAAESVVEQYGTSCSGSRFMNGTLDLHEQLEVELAEFVGKEAALCYTTGYQTNLGAISAVLDKGDHVISDKYNHASIMDAIFLTTGMKRNITLHRYKHNNMEELERILKRIPKNTGKLIVTDGVFSMEGDLAELVKMRELADTYKAGIYLDEAHALGVVGKTGRGTCEHYGDNSLADLLMCTFSKSFGSIGGFISGSAEIIDYIKHTSRPLIFSASMPPANIAAARKALEIIKEEPERVHRLQEIAKKMISGFKSIGFNVGTAVTPIVPLIIGNNEKTFLFWKSLYERGIYVNPVISPGVPPKRSLIRTSFMSIHKDDELDWFLEVAEQEGKKLGII